MWMFGTHKLAGIIVFGGGLNHEYYIAQAKADGFKVVRADGRALLYRVGK